MFKQLACIAFFVVALAELSYGGSKDLATFTPPLPKVGDRINVVYDGGVKTAALIGAKSVNVNALVLRSEGMPNLIEVPLSQSGKQWKGSFVLDDPKAQMILIKFVSGDKTDDNNENCWDLMVHGKDGKPVKGAFLWRGQLVMYGGGYGYRKTKDVDAGTKELQKELTLYPDNSGAYGILWNAELRATPGDETKAKIRKDVWVKYEQFKNNQEAVIPVLSMMERLGQKSEADSLRRELVAKEPKGKLAESVRLMAVYAEKDPAKKTDLLKSFLADFPKTADETKALEENLTMSLVYSYLQAKDYEKAADKLGTMSNPRGDLYNTIAWAVIEKGEKGPELDKAIGWAKKGIDVMKENKEPKPTYMSTGDWNKNKDFSLGMITDTYAFGLFKSGKTKEAELAYEEAVKLTEGKQADINERYLDACIENGHNEKAMSTASDLIKNGNMSDNVVAKYRTAYTKVKGTAEGFDELIAKAKDQSLQEAKKTIMKERINKPAIDFALKGTDGKTVKLSALRGSVVVVDFWATWCGPCKSSFPYLQKMYEKYKDNPNVKILALDTWENESGTKREELVKKFMADNKYTFPVLYDEGFVEKYGVEGIPTKFIIDKKGKIQFKSVGFLNGQKMMDEMTLEIDMLLGDEFYSMN